MIADMCSFNFAIVFQALVVLLVAVSQVNAGPLPLQGRSTLSVYDPVILEPQASSNWLAGTQQVVSWDNTNAPKSISNQGHVVLKTMPATPDQPSQWKHLAGPFSLTAGQIEVAVPSDVISGEYRIILFGDSGNESPTFHVNGVDKSHGHLPSNDNNDSYGSSGSHLNKDN